MVNNRNGQPVTHKLSDKAVYKIGVAGEIASNWQDYLETISVTWEIDEYENAMTILTCEILDQAQLMGILNMLYAWNTPLIWLDRIGGADIADANVN